MRCDCSVGYSPHHGCIRQAIFSDASLFVEIDLDVSGCASGLGRIKHYEMTYAGKEVQVKPVPGRQTIVRAADKSSLVSIYPGRPPRGRRRDRR